MIAFGESSFLLITLLFINFANIISAAPSWTLKGFCWDKIDTIFVFGDSYSYVEGKLGTPEFSWNNFTSPGDVHHSPILLNKTSAGGPNWVEYLTGCFQGLPQACQPHLYDIAFAGSDIDPATITKHHPYTKSFIEQIDQWKANVNGHVPWKSSNTLATFWMGINDVGDTWKWTNVSFPNFYNQIIDTYFDRVNELYHLNMRSFMFFNVPARDRSPGAGNQEQREKYNGIIKTFNSVLANHVDKFQSDHPDANVISIDAFALFNEYLDQAKELGFKDISSYCPNSTAPDFNINYEKYGCLAPYEYFWLNSGHPTYPVHQLLASSIDKQLEDYSQC